MKNHKPLLFCLLSVLMSAGQSHAQQPNVTPQRTQQPRPILYSPHVPRAILKQMPNGHKTRFFGSFKLLQNAPTSFVHLYNSADTSDGVDPQKKFTLALFEAVDRNHYRLVQRVALNYEGWHWAYNTFGAQLLWLNPAEKRGPIIKIDAFDPKATYGSSGDNILLMFPDGLNENPKIQTLTFGAWHSSDTSGQENWFDELDKNGLFQVKSQIHLATSEVPMPAPSIYLLGKILLSAKSK